MTFNILLAGIGGLGAISISVILARAAKLDGYYVSGTQVHGLAQRGGSVPVQIRFGKEEVFSPVISKGEADLIIGLELIEGLRYANLSNKERTGFLIDTKKVRPILSMNYPSIEEIKNEVEKISKKSVFVDAAEKCKNNFDNSIIGGVMLLGVAIKEGLVPLSKESIMKAIEVTVPKNTLESNLKAFELGSNH